MAGLMERIAFAFLLTCASLALLGLAAISFKVALNG